MKPDSGLHETGATTRMCTALHTPAFAIWPGQLDKSCADVMINESAKSYQALNPLP